MRRSKRDPIHPEVWLMHVVHHVRRVSAELDVVRGRRVPTVATRAHWRVLVRALESNNQKEAA